MFLGMRSDGSRVCCTCETLGKGAKQLSDAQEECAGSSGKRENLKRRVMTAEVAEARQSRCSRSVCDESRLPCDYFADQLVRWWILMLRSPSWK